MNDLEIVTVVEAKREGRQIERRYILNAVLGDWIESDRPLWNFVDWEYRIKPIKPIILSLEDWSCGVGGDKYWVNENKIRSIHRKGGTSDNNLHTSTEFIELTDEVKRKLGME